MLIDDIYQFAMPGQEPNLIWLGKTYNDRPRFELSRLEDPARAATSAPNRKEWQRDRDKLLPPKNAVLRALELTRKTGGKFLDHLKNSTVRTCADLFASAS